MFRQRESSRYRTLGLIPRAGIFNAVLVTVVAALTITLFSRAGIEIKRENVGVGASRHDELKVTWHPVEFGKAALWLCLFTAVTCGSFGLFAGLIGGGLMYRRAQRIRSTKRFLAETTILGFLLACIFPFVDAWISQAQVIGQSYIGVDVFAPVFGCLCAFLCGLCFQKRFLDVAKGAAPSSAGG